MTRPKRPYRFEVYYAWSFVQKRGKHFWRLVAPNGEPVADGCQGYTRKSDCLKAVARVQKGVPGASVEVLP